MSDATTILILDDEPNIRSSLGRALELEGYEVVTAANLAEAKSQLENLRPQAALFDVRLPDGDGLDLLEELRESQPELPVIMMSGHASIDDAVRAVQLGALDFLEKPVGQDRLLLTLSNTIERSRLRRENQALRAEAKERQGAPEIIGSSAAIRGLKEQIERVAQSEGRVLITGENGTGKELVALAVHAASRRADETFVSLNCAAVPAELIESELFGHERGAFTGALARKMGKFERADGGTLFLDEVGDMPANMQAKLLRVLQTGELERVGGNKTLRVDVRVLAATNKDLQAEIAAGRFREDLYYRLNVVPLVSPPLRDRKEDIPLLAARFVEEAARKNHRSHLSFAKEALALLAGHDYPGNVRELRNLVERIVILAPGDRSELDESDVRPHVPNAASVGGGGPKATLREGTTLAEMLRDVERQLVTEAMANHDNKIPDAARSLGIERSNFHKKLKALGLK